MSALLQAEPDTLAELRTRAQQCCLAFADEPLPPGASQPTGRVGVEIDPNSGRALLHVDRNIRYDGPIPEVAAWFSSGTRAFATYDDLQAWLAGPLATAYRSGSTDTNSSLRDEDPDRDELEPAFVDQVDIANALATEVVGQADPILELADGVALHLARRQPRRPFTALALGPTGVGKTLVAETLAETIQMVTGNDCDYLRLDMSEFQERHTVAKFFGAPPGYIGYGDTPALVDALRSGRRVVVLIDEIEKAHTDVFLALMNVMDAGRITTSSGEEIDARHAIMIFTTNLAVDVVASELDANPDLRNDRIARDAFVRTTLRNHGIAPELVGRLMRLMVFEALTGEHLDEVLRRTIRREAVTFGLRAVDIHHEVVDLLRAHTPDAGSGVRAWEYLVSAQLGQALADAARQGHQGDVTILADPLHVEPLATRDRDRG